MECSGSKDPPYFKISTEENENEMKELCSHLFECISQREQCEESAKSKENLLKERKNTECGRRRSPTKWLNKLEKANDRKQRHLEAAVFQKGKEKEDVTSNNVTTAQDWRKSMVSSIENVRGFAETTTVNTTVTNGRTDSSTNAVTPGKALGQDESEPKHVLPNGTGSAVANDSSDECRKSGTETVSKRTDQLMNGDVSCGHSVSESHAENTQGTVNAAVVENESKKTSSKGSASSNLESETVKQLSKENSPTISAKPGTSGQTGLQVPMPNSDLKLLSCVKKKKSPSVETPAGPKKAKLATLTSLTTPSKSTSLATPISTTASIQLPQSKNRDGVMHLNVTTTVPVGIPPPRAFPSTSGAASTSTAKPDKGHRLPPLKITAEYSCHVSIRQDCTYTLNVSNHHRRPDGLCHQVMCRHAEESLNGLNWTIACDTPISSICGDVHRVVFICENASLHVLDLKGRYAFPPLMLSALPSKVSLNGPFLAILTTKAVLHVWNLHAKSMVLKSESLVHLLHQTEAEKERDGPLDFSRIQITPGGIPNVYLNTGKVFKYNKDLCAWLLMSDPRGLVSSSMIVSHEQNLNIRSMTSNGDRSRFINRPEPAVVSHIKLKLAQQIEMKNSDGVKQWILALGKTLAANGSRTELHQLCTDLLGPTHSSASHSQRWSPTIIDMVDKRVLLRQMLTLVLDDLRYQDFYTEFDDLLRDVEMPELSGLGPL